MIFLVALITMVIFAPKPVKKQQITQPIQLIATTQPIQPEKPINKNILLIFCAEWCGPCKNLGKILELPAVKMATSTYIVRHIDVDKESTITQNYKINGIPAYIIVAPTGQILKTGKGYKDEQGFLLWLNNTK